MTCWNNPIRFCSHQNIGAILTKIYMLWISSGYITENNIKFSPHAAHDLPIAEFLDGNISESAFNLLLKIPSATNSVRLALNEHIID